MDELLVFVVFRITVLLVSFYAGFQISKRKRGISFLWLPVLLFTINEGLRFGRGVDYNGYYFKYNDILKYGFTESKEFLFICFCKLNNLLGLPYQGLVLMMSLILILAGVYFIINGHLRVAAWAIPLFTLFTVEAENLMRWFLGFSFILIGLSKLYNSKHKSFLICSIVGFLFHNALVIVIPIYYGLYYIKKPILLPTFSLIIYLFLHVMFLPEMLGDYAKYAFSLNVTDQYSGYVANAENWLTGVANYEAPPLNIGVVINDLIVICLGYKILSLIPKMTFLYNIYLVGVVLSPMLYQIEILMRFNMLFKLFEFVLIAYIFQLSIKERVFGKWYRIASYLILFNLIRIYIINLFFVENIDSILYVWDSMGRNVLHVK